MSALPTPTAGSHYVALVESRLHENASGIAKEPKVTSSAACLSCGKVAILRAHELNSSEYCTGCGFPLQQQPQRGVSDRVPTIASPAFSAPTCLATNSKLPPLAVVAKADGQVSVGQPSYPLYQRPFAQDETDHIIIVETPFATSEEREAEIRNKKMKSDEITALVVILLGLIVPYVWLFAICLFWKSPSKRAN